MLARREHNARKLTKLELARMTPHGEESGKMIQKRRRGGRRKQVRLEFIS